MAKSQRERIDKLEDQLKERDRRIADLKTDVARLEDLVTRQAEHIQDCGDQIDRWIAAFDMVLDDNGMWKWSRDFVEGHQWYEKYGAIVRDWNRFVPEYNAAIGHGRNVGRPLAASEAQIEQVRKLHKQGMSLRGIVDETSLGLQTVRTIIDQRDRKDRTARNHLERIKPDREQERSWLAKKRMRDALPKSINVTRATCDELAKEAKGLTR
jgi:hypothetical protein